MPELPEVETVRQGLLPVLEGRRLIKVENRRADLRRPFPPDFARRLTGRKVQRLYRRAKYLLAELDQGETLVIHLGMSGRMSVGVDGSVDGKKRALGIYAHTADLGSGKHDHVLFETDAPARIVFTDHRRFGLMDLIETHALEQHPLFRAMGPEPLSNHFNGAVLQAALKGKKTPIKSALLDQRVVAGLGNIYVCEALHLAQISPKRLADKVPSAKMDPLVHHIKTILLAAIESGGSSLRDHARTDGTMGYFQHNFRAYDRMGSPCPTPGCKGVIKRMTQAGRSTFYCTACQK